ncbi:FimB/Mfa2 family fimbrial subunit [Porphyromonas gulae]|uniref:FimB/Mfa2 family fimbrial subunit n=1 Tax=Porphyromonas gulae TaxID=111105 RepID=UPI00052C529D|nr:FimB/Mfa2 family fimbrial subunit [Porphyromonas gulae]KGN92310.1 major fimbrial subunit protein (FimA) [Porphyromonas gulae]
MMLIKMRYIAFAAFVSVLFGCNKGVEPQPDTQPDVYLAVTARAAHTNGEESINMDMEDFEDRVHSLSMLVFDSGTGNKIAEHFTTTIESGVASYAFTTKLTPGQRDFFFIANMPGSQAAMSAIANKTDMHNFMNQVRELSATHYLGATDNSGFPMAREYRNQTVAIGGTPSNPIPFKPNGEENVKLIRVVGKLEINLTVGIDNLEKVELFNANRHFSLSSIQTPPTQYFGPIEMRRVQNANTFLAYMPEAIVEPTNWWGNTGDIENKPINFFRITTKGGIMYDVPIITHDNAIPGGQYLPFAKAELSQKPDYTIYRNHHYKYQVKNLPDKIEVKYSISDWNVVTNDTYMGYGYNVEVDDEGNITITNTIPNCDPHIVRLKAQNGAYFGTDATHTMVEFSQLADGATQTFKVNKDAVPVGSAYLEVYYNQVPGTAGAGPDKVFIKK